MKRYFAAAGALLLGTSTLALAADVKPLDVSGSDSAAVATDTKVATEAKTIDMSSDKSTLAAKPELDAGTDAKVEFASLDKDLEKLALAETDAKVQTASVDTAAKTDATGMGGPVETDVTATVSLTPQTAAQNYPPCDPGPGDDRCIQLYEDGVRDQLASWNRPTGGLLDNRATTAMGGPFEPVDTSAKPAEADLVSAFKPETDVSAGVGGPFEPVDEAAVKPTEADAQLVSAYKPESADIASGVGGPFEPVDNDATELAMNGDGSIDASAGETAATEAATGALAQSEVTQHSEFTGVGGPVEAQSGYPPCDPGPGDDRCIQLYEAGVSGAGN